MFAAAVVVLAHVLDVITSFRRLRKYGAAFFTVYMIPDNFINTIIIIVFIVCIFSAALGAGVITIMCD